MARKTTMFESCHEHVLASVCGKETDRTMVSPEQISGYLRREMDIVCSTKAIYKFAGSRCLKQHLFWGWNRRKSGRKRYRSDTPKEGRAYINKRPAAECPGHFEMDFMVFKQSSWVLLVVVDRAIRYATTMRLPNKKRTTILGALSDVFPRYLCQQYYHG